MPSQGLEQTIEWVTGGQAAAAPDTGYFGGVGAAQTIEVVQGGRQARAFGSPGCKLVRLDADRRSYGSLPHAA